MGERMPFDMLYFVRVAAELHLGGVDLAGQAPGGYGPHPDYSIIATCYQSGLIKGVEGEIENSCAID